ncbi:uncharacterized protein B0I36DRAFT_352625 [Microdochium trichocladiopsis]|uniref:Glycosyltransferase family 31 protein n=1 Tax=Microdochium trichocladiopsis TaxID=1682393 RepID=A0A9P9BL00_9PEZI|nr:uncharacterized protein B0I36DRAFT_352625 [Microdochium trichocladiopsis]KAH7024384.1 hypothetical protein B0I36DRAFT_352625 [Microdochium trichocladiopsis]
MTTIATLSITITTLLVLLWCQTAPDGSRAPFGSILSILSTPAPQHELFGIRGFASDVEVAFIDIHFDQTRDEQSIPLVQGLGSNMAPFTTFQLASAPMTNSSLSPEAYISKHVGTRHRVTAKIPQITRPVDASHMIFGLSTSLGRIPETIRNLKHWAAHTNARFLIVVAPHNPAASSPAEPTIPEAEALFAAAGIPHVTFLETADDWIDAYIGLIAPLHAAVEPGLTRWVAWIDDDTFFPRLSALTAALDSRFDPSRPQYVGQLSEYFPHTAGGGMIAFGGAGIFVSVPLLEQIAPHAGVCYKHRRKGAYTGGDFRLADCIHRYTATKLSVLQGLSQLSLKGDASGFYEAEREQPLSVHHWKSWHHVDVPGVARVAEVCGDACVLQHFRLGGGGWAMTNGFSIVKHGAGYGRLMRDDEFDKLEQEEEKAGTDVEVSGVMEKTWDTSRWDAADAWEFSLAPLADKDAGKKQYLMEKMDRDDEGNMVVDYVLRERGVGRGLIRVRLMAA